MCGCTVLGRCCRCFHFADGEMEALGHTLGCSRARQTPQSLEDSASSLAIGTRKSSSHPPPPAATSLGAKKASAFIPWGLREGGRSGAYRAGPELRGRTHACRGRAGRPWVPPGRPFSGCRLTISASLSVLPPCLSVPALSWPPLCFSLHVCQPICLSWSPPHPTHSTGHGKGRAGLGEA